MDMIKVRIARSVDVPPGKSAVFTLPNGEEIAIFHVKDAFYAIQNQCPHQGGPLGEGEITGQCVTCPWHGWEFDLTSGDCLTGGENCKTFTVVEEDGALYLKIPNPDQV